MNRVEILGWLRESREEKLTELWRMAARVREQYLGDDVHVRGLIEFSNHCRRSCTYCGIRAPNRNIIRYRMSSDEIMACVKRAVRLEFKTIVLQSGEDPQMSTEWMTQLIHRIKEETPLAVTLSLGERTDEELSLFRRAGADRYLLRFETSNSRLYRKIHPPLPGRKTDRIAILSVLRDLDYEVGSGVMVGLPGQTYQDLVQDIDLFQKLDLDMIGLGPYIPHPDTELARLYHGDSGSSFEQVPNTEAMTYKALALTRICRPLANIPVTTAIATLDKTKGYKLGLERGANVIMPNLTPLGYRKRYEIYPNKVCDPENDYSDWFRIRSLILNQKRNIGKGRGDSLNFIKRMKVKQRKRIANEANA